MRAITAVMVAIIAFAPADEILIVLTLCAVRRALAVPRPNQTHRKGYIT